MDPVKEECQARRAEEQAQRDQQPVALVLNKERGRKRTKSLHMFHKTLRMLYLICTDANLLSNY